MKFKEIFEGNNSAYGQLILSGSTTDKGKAEGKAEGEKNKAIEVAKSLLVAGINIDVISNSTGLSLEDIKKLEKQSKKA